MMITLLVRVTVIYDDKVVTAGGLCLTVDKVVASLSRIDKVLLLGLHYAILNIY